MNCQKKNVSVLVEKISCEIQSEKIILAFGIPKPAAFEFIIKRCSEVGLYAFQPLVTRFSQYQGYFNQKKWEKIILEISKQCEQTYFPKLLPAMAFSEWLKKTAHHQPIICCSSSHRYSKIDTEELKKLSLKHAYYSLLIGPEGDFSQQELAEIENAASQLQDYSFKYLGLGKNRLRTETAALTAIIVLKRLLE